MDALSLNERALPCQANAHAFRHTFGTQSVADEVPVDVVQKVLGHASLATPRSMCRPRKSACSKKSPAIIAAHGLHPIPHGEQYLNAGFAM